MGQAIPFEAFVGPSYRVPNVVADQEACINLFVERMESRGAKSRMVLNSTPGVQAWTSVDVIGGKGIFEIISAGVERSFAVVATDFYELFADGNVTLRGSVAVDMHPATISSNGDGGGQLFITSGGNGYCFDLTTNTLTLELTATATMGGMIDGYFLALDTATATLYVSDLLDGTGWDPTQFAQRSDAPDPWLSMVVTRNYIYLLGEQTSCVFYDAGAFPFPFAFAPGSSMAYGVAAIFGAGIVGGAVTWMSHNADGERQVVQVRGFTPIVISTRGIEYELSQADHISDAEVLTYQEQGHLFFVLNLTSDEHTWVYDQTEGFWHQRGTWDEDTAAYDVWHAQSHAYAFGKHLVLDRFSGTIYEMSTEFHTDFGDAPLRRLRRSPSLFKNNEWLRHNRLELVARNGVGLPTGQGSDPKVVMRFSDDGGRTWSSELEAGIGAIGEYQTRAFWTRLGIARDRVYEIYQSDPVPCQWVEATINVSEEAA